MSEPGRVGPGRAQPASRAADADRQGPRASRETPAPPASGRHGPALFGSLTFVRGYNHRMRLRAAIIILVVVAVALLAAQRRSRTWCDLVVRQPAVGHCWFAASADGGVVLGQGSHRPVDGDPILFPNAALPVRGWRSTSFRMSDVERQMYAVAGDVSPMYSRNPDNRDPLVYAAPRHTILGVGWTSDPRRFDGRSVAGYDYVRVPYRHLLGGTGLLAGIVAVGLARQWRAVRRPSPGRCSACGYDLRATPGRCPECGAAAGVTG